MRADLEDDKACLVTTAEEGPQTIVTLLMVGRATPYLHNGIVYVGDEDHYVRSKTRSHLDLQQRVDSCNHDSHALGRAAVRRAEPLGRRLPGVGRHR